LVGSNEEKKMSRFVSVDSERFEQFLQSHNFEREVFHNEVVYSRKEKKNENLVIKVYTSIRIGDEAARDVGKDAIRVIALFHSKEKDYPIYKGARVYRTGTEDGVFSRTLDRICEASDRCDEWLIEQGNKKAERTNKNSSPDTVGEWMGNIGEEVKISVVIVNRKPWMNQFIFTMKDDDDHTFVYWTNLDLLQVGEHYDLRGMVSNHNIFLAVKQTILKDVRGKRILQKNK
jgi:hypothetical protein